MSLAEQTVLALLSQQPRHGFAVAQLTARGGELGRIWHIPKAVIYRSIARLTEAGLVTPHGTQPGLGPQRTVHTATAPGRQAAQHWLDAPVQHVRDIRSHLLLKLAILDRAGADATALLCRQRVILEPIAQAFKAGEAQETGFDAVLLAWRQTTAAAAMDFLDTIASREARQ